MRINIENSTIEKSAIGSGNIVVSQSGSIDWDYLKKNG